MTAFLRSSIYWLLSFGCAAVLALLASTTLASRRGPTIPSLVTQPHADVGDAVRFSGKLRREVFAGLSDALGDSPTPTSTTAVVLLSAVDVATCEDLGRQLRELHRKHNPYKPLIVLSTEGDQAAIRAFIRSERLGRSRLVAVRDMSPIVGMGPIPTPAGMIVDSAGAARAGIAYRFKSPNLRVNSFAAQLRDALDEEPRIPERGGE